MHPIEDKTDIPECVEKDKSEIIFSQVHCKWREKYGKYFDDVEKFEKNKANLKELINVKTLSESQIVQARSLLRLKHPKKPSLVMAILKGLASPTIIMGPIAQLIGVCFQLAMPVMMQLLLRKISPGKSSNTDADAESFPYVPAIVLVLCPFLSNIFDALAFRVYFHMLAELRAALAALVYNKILHMRIPANSNVTTGRLISLIAQDSGLIGEFGHIVLNMLFLPVQMLLPFALCIGTLQVHSLVVAGILAIVLIVQFWVSTRINEYCVIYQNKNDLRNAVTNEVIERIRTVKFCGAESVFMAEVDKSRAPQVASSARIVLFQQVSYAIVRGFSLFANAGTFAAFIAGTGMAQQNFSTMLIPLVGFFQGMIEPTGPLVFSLQCAVVLRICLERISNFLLLPEHPQYARPSKGDTMLSPGTSPSLSSAFSSLSPSLSLPSSSPSASPFSLSLSPASLSSCSASSPASPSALSSLSSSSSSSSFPYAIRISGVSFEWGTAPTLAIEVLKDSEGGLMKEHVEGEQRGLGQEKGQGQEEGKKGQEEGPGKGEGKRDEEGENSIAAQLRILKSIYKATMKTRTVERRVHGQGGEGKLRSREKVVVMEEMKEKNEEEIKRNEKEKKKKMKEEIMKSQFRAEKKKKADTEPLFPHPHFTSSPPSSFALPFSLSFPSLSFPSLRLPGLSLPTPSSSPTAPDCNAHPPPTPRLGCTQDTKKSIHLYELVSYKAFPARDPASALAPPPPLLPVDVPVDVPAPPSSAHASADPPALTPLPTTSFSSDSSASSSLSSSSSSSESSTPSPSSSFPLDSPSSPFVLSNVSLFLPRGTLTIIVGRVGSGKSSLASAFIGEMRGDKPFAVDGSVAYCPQVPWITNNTVRGNILFGSPYEKEKYERVVRLCLLEDDFKQFACGDQTPIGEKGVNLSGGQKARIQLARAVYADKDVCVLDDPLSAVDARVGRDLFDSCICGELKQTRGKTIILVTNQLQYADQSDLIVVLEQGRIVWRGTPSQRAAEGIDLTQYLAHDAAQMLQRRREEKEREERERKKAERRHHVLREAHKEKKRERERQRKKAATEKKRKEKEKRRRREKKREEKEKRRKKEEEEKEKEQENMDGGEAEEGKTKENKELEDEEVIELQTGEEQETGSLSPGLYLGYITTLMPWYLFPFYFFLFLLGEFGSTFSQYWLGCMGSSSRFGFLSFPWKMGVYAILAAVVLAVFIVRAVCTALAVWRGDTKIHNTLLHCVMHCPVSFFDTTPTGRILNRFTNDVSMADMNMHSNFNTTVSLWLSGIGQVVVIGISAPLFFAIGGSALILFYLFLSLNSRATRNLKRITSMALSPLLSVLSESISGAGLASIRAYKVEKEWTKKFYTCNDAFTSRLVLLNEGQMFCSLYSSLLSSMLMAGVLFFGWFHMEVNDLAVALTAGMSFSWRLTSIVKQDVECEAMFTSFERLYFYSRNIPQETTEGKEPPEEWPQHGRVTFEDVSFRYRPGLPNFALKGVSFEVNAGERVGVCGRTGAGKSSLLQVLFRLVELDPTLAAPTVDVATGRMLTRTEQAQRFSKEPPNHGRVLIDGVDISTVPLERLRRAVCIIPQDPTLFAGNVRFNVDLRGCHDDARIWDVLELVQMKDIVHNMGGLDAPVAEGGKNLSLGQCQLLCFARAILCDSRVMVMDEATASVDYASDQKIQAAIRTLKDKTMLVIAHRLNTIEDSDRILVVDAMSVSESESGDAGEDGGHEAGPKCGHVCEFNTPTNLRSNPASLYNELLRCAGETNASTT